MLINYSVLEDFWFAKFSGEISLFCISDSNITRFPILIFHGSDMEETRDFLRICLSLVPMLRFINKLPICVMSFNGGPLSLRKTVSNHQIHP